MMDKWLGRSAAELGRAIEAGKINPVDLTEAFLDAIARHPETKRIYARTTADHARSTAVSAAGRQAAGTRIGPLDGVPLSWKDNFDVAGVECEAGSALLQGRMPKEDAEVLHTATTQGLVCLGKTHMTELAFSGLGLNPMTATPPCINFPEAVPGGSSSGAAASVAFGLAAAAIGSDTGGSVRVPAAWNDLVGLKTTAGRLSLKGVVPLCETFDTVGPLATTVEDCALILSALTARRAADLKGASLSNARFGVLKTVALEDLRDAPALGFEDALRRMANAGATIDEFEAPEVAEAVGLAGLLFTPEAYAIWGETIEAAPQKMFPPVLERFRAGGTVKATGYISAWRRLNELRKLWERRVGGFDAVLIPTTPILPPDARRLLEDPAYFAAENLLALRNTRIGNLMGLCALTLPTGQPSCGISLMGPAMQEERLLRLGAAVERALG
jgi:aspartyl-tRNA(Asn)/glutamyl-tRNA(Gln) amidotransferase subunit A